MNITDTVLKEWKRRDPFLSDLAGFERYFNKRYPVLARKAEREAKKKFEALVRGFTDPLIVMAPEWADTIPGWMKREVTLRRLIQVMKGNYDDEATDIEACICLYTASLRAPFGRDWTEIYLYLCIKCMEEAGRRVPEDFVKEMFPSGNPGLDKWQERKLRNLKVWIRERQKKLPRGK